MRRRTGDPLVYLYCIGLRLLLRKNYEIISEYLLLKIYFHWRSIFVVLIGHLIQLFKIDYARF